MLGVLDNKIKINRRMNETLEAIARAIFKSWFLDIAEDTVPFSSIAMISRDAVNPSEYPTESFDHYSIPAFNEGRLPITESGSQIKSNKFVVSDDSVLLSKLNPRIPRVWMPLLPTVRRAICSPEFLVLKPKGVFALKFIYNLCTSQSFLDEFTTMVTGKSGSHQRVKPEYLEQMQVLKPNGSTLEKFIDVVRPLHSRVAQNLRESSVLASLRDALLPKLMSGEIRLKDAEKLPRPTHEHGVVESTVEEAALSWFEELGYTVVHGPDIAPGELFAERESYGDVVLVKRLREAFSESIRNSVRSHRRGCPPRAASRNCQPDREQPTLSPNAGGRRPRGIPPRQTAPLLAIWSS